MIQPLDTIKVRIQIKGEERGMSGASGATGKVNTGPFGVASDILKNDGVKGFYRGLGSAILR